MDKLKQQPKTAITILRGDGISDEEKRILLRLFIGAAYSNPQMHADFEKLSGLWKMKLHTITYAFTQVTSDNMIYDILTGDSYTAQLIADENYEVNNVVVTMDGVDITETCYDKNTCVITIHNVTGDISITADSRYIRPAIREVILDQESAKLVIGETTQLNARTIPEDWKDDVVWSSSNDNIITVEDGNVTTINRGKAAVIATVKDKSDRCEITVTGEIALNRSSAFVALDDKLQLTATTIPSTGVNVVWKCEPVDGATVENGVVTPLKEGPVTITAYLEDEPETSATCNVIVKWAGYRTSYEITDPVTFNGVDDQIIETGVRLYDSVIGDNSINPAWTIFCDVECSEDIENNKGNRYCVFHCMNEDKSAGWPGIAMAVQAGNGGETSTIGVNIYNARFTATPTTDIRGLRFRCTIKIDGNKTISRCTYQPNNLATNYSMNRNVEQQLVVGGYLDVEGNHGRFFQGTVHYFKVVNELLSDEQCLEFINGLPKEEV